MAKSVVLGGEIYLVLTALALFLKAEANSFLASANASLSFAWYASSMALNFSMASDYLMAPKHLEA